MKKKWNLPVVLENLTKLFLSAALVDAGYVLYTVDRMSTNAPYAMERYHAIPEMAEHILAALVVYLVGMVLIHKMLKR